MLRLGARGLSNPGLVERQYLVQATVKTHVTSIYTKLGICGRGRAVVIA